MSRAGVNEEVMNEIVLGSTRGGRRPVAPLQVALVRELGEDDIEALRGGALRPANVSLRTIRNSHHKLAQALALGHTNEEASLITGYSPAWICTIQGDQAFQSLMEYYQANREAVFVDVLERAKQLGLTAMEELQERLEQAPQEFSRRELMEVVDLAINKVGQGGGQRPSAGSSPGVNLQINFVAPAGGAITPTIEHGK